ncbi:hypothetical protein EB796_015771 [Bugula neritina]|uniref:Amino acid transporter transmembrane domain-containing protein n=1 Tax=Bugula neritina TaxID=10212 RepID=A0A7J7JHV8_BUGNE|nr:hypothetical protein EB796_015771 [Bugula neritina]
MGARESKDDSVNPSGEYPHASILRGEAESEREALLAVGANGGSSSNAVQAAHKLTVGTAMVFIVGEMAGSGVLALPKAVENTERFPEYQEQCRDPYPAIGFEAFGRPGRVLVTVCVSLTLFGVSVVFMLLAATNFSAVFQQVPALGFSPCFWMIILVAILTPFVWLGTPKDFWPIAVGATVATAIACGFLIAAIVSYSSTNLPSKVTHTPIDVKSFALAFGTILFSFGGASAFPTIQHDMGVTTDFPRAVFLGFAVLMVLYLPVAAVGYSLLGSNLSDNILDTLKAHPTWMYYLVQVLICLHLLSAFTIVINPLCQGVEKLFKVPPQFTWKRVVTRTACTLLALLVGELVPHFGPILSLIGGSTTTLLSFVFPCAFYWRLCSMDNRGWPRRSIELHEKIFAVFMITIGLVGGVISTYSAISALASGLVPPCFINTTDIL